MSESLDRLARRAEIDPFFLAYALAEYARAEQLDEASLATVMGTTPEVLAHVRLCRTPRTDADGFRQDVDRIAAKFGVDREILAAVARHSQTVAAMRTAEAIDPSAAGYLLAARDRKPS